MEIDNYLKQCALIIDRRSAAGAGAHTVRIPARPIVITFLGEHAAEGKSRFNDTLKKGWPTEYARLAERIYSYSSPELFSAAIEDVNDSGVSQIDKAVLSAIDGARDPNLLMIYFVCFNNSNAQDYLKLLDRPYTTPLGGTKERLIFAIGKTSNSVAMQQAKEYLRCIQETVAHTSDAEELWRQTSCVVLSDYLYGGAAIREDSYLDNYVLAVDILLMQYSVHIEADRISPVIMPRVTSPMHPFITACFLRESKPSDDIARAVLHAYFSKGVAFSRETLSVELNNEELLEKARIATKNLFKELLNTNAFPDETSIRHLPNGAERGEDVGMIEGKDKTHGVWRLFCKKYYNQPVLDRWGNPDDLVEYFSNYYSVTCGFSCGTITKLFPSFGEYLEQLGEDDFLSANQPQSVDRLSKWGIYEAQITLIKLCYSALCCAVNKLSAAAIDYVSMLASFAGQVTPLDDSVNRFYGNLSETHLSSSCGDTTFEKILRSPCSENQMPQRITSFINSVTTLPEMLLNFFDDLKIRLEDAAANNHIHDFLSLPDHELVNNVRFRADNLEELCKASLFDSNTLGIKGDTLFELCGTNCIDRVVLYSFDRIFN